MDDWSRVGVGRDDPWERNHLSLVNNRVDRKNFYLECHNIVPRNQQGTDSLNFSFEHGEFSNSQKQKQAVI